MFVSQVTFETEKENEPILKKIAGKKLSGAEKAEGLISSECWKSEKQDIVGYTLVNRWESKDNFKVWMAQEHAGGHKKSDTSEPNRPLIKKTACQYETLTIADLN